MKTTSTKPLTYCEYLILEILNNSHRNILPLVFQPKNRHQLPQYAQIDGVNRGSRKCEEKKEDAYEKPNPRTDVCANVEVKTSAPELIDLVDDDDSDLEMVTPGAPNPTPNFIDLTNDSNSSTGLPTNDAKSETKEVLHFGTETQIPKKVMANEGNSRQSSLEIPKYGSISSMDVDRPANPVSTSKTSENNLVEPQIVRRECEWNVESSQSPRRERILNSQDSNASSVAILSHSVDENLHHMRFENWRLQNEVLLHQLYNEKLLIFEREQKLGLRYSGILPLENYRY